MIELEFLFQRYLAAKKTIDDRSLNQHVWQQLVLEVEKFSNPGPFKVIELGCGIGTMVERVLEWDLFSTDAEYYAVDSDGDNISFAQKHLLTWGHSNGYIVSIREGEFFSLERKGKSIHVKFIEMTAQDFWDSFKYKCDLLIAHAFLDLLPLPSSLLSIFKLLTDRGMFYFTINFDGVTLFSPTIMVDLDDYVIKAYHQTMDEVLVGGESRGGSKTGRKLIEYLLSLDAKIIAAGSSDWVVYPDENGYRDDDAYFLSFILHFFESSLSNYPGVDQQKLDAWLRSRRQQIDQKKLIYIAHQLDILGRKGKQSY